MDEKADQDVLDRAAELTDSHEGPTEDSQAASVDPAGTGAEEPGVETQPSEESPAEARSAEEPPAEEPFAPDAPSEADDASGAEPVTRPRGGPAGWPFLVYLAAWVALAVTTAVVLTSPDAAAVPIEDRRYPALLLAGITLVAFGPVLVAVTWVEAFVRSEKGCRGGLLTTALVRGASATLFGVIVWWGSLVLVDALRLGLI